jgi:uncharacterized protein with FMN-binding domain
MRDALETGGPRSTPHRGTSGTGQGRSPRRKLARSLLTLGSAAIVAIYTAGYIRTAPIADRIAADESRVRAMVRTASPTILPTVPAGISTGEIATPGASPPAASPTPASPATATPSPAAPPASPYRDGTYTGVGSSRHGEVEATVVIRQGKIVSAEITGCMMRYPCSLISDLPTQVVSRQDANVDLVSGATDSSYAYQAAVADALAKAQAS